MEPSEVVRRLVESHQALEEHLAVRTSGRQTRCYHCDEPNTGTTFVRENAYGPACAQHGGPPAPMPRTLAQVVTGGALLYALLAAERSHLVDLVFGYAADGFPFGITKEGLVAWGHESRILANIGGDHSTAQALLDRLRPHVEAHLDPTGQ